MNILEAIEYYMAEGLDEETATMMADMDFGIWEPDENYRDSFTEEWLEEEEEW